MRLEKQDQTTSAPTQSPPPDHFIVGQREDLACDDQTSSNSPATNSYLPLIARATNDAVRDWNVKTGALSWPQGFTSLLGYNTSSAEQHINFWQEKIHSRDRDRVCTSISDAITGTSDHWSGEYRFRRADGSDVNVLERALILRDASGLGVATATFTSCASPLRVPLPWTI